jgi:hypothetical protein
MAQLWRRGLPAPLCCHVTERAGLQERVNLASEPSSTACVQVLGVQVRSGSGKEGDCWTGL